MEDVASNNLKGYPDHRLPDRSHEGTLVHRLALTKLESEPRSVHRQTVRRQQEAGYAGSTLSTHLGNLQVEFEMRQRTRRHKNQTRHKDQPKRYRKYSPETIDDTDEEEGEYQYHEEAEEEEGGEEEKPMVFRAIAPAPPNTDAHFTTPTINGLKRARSVSEVPKILTPPPGKRRAVMRFALPPSASSCPPQTSYQTPCAQLVQAGSFHEGERWQGLSAGTADSEQHREIRLLQAQVSVEKEHVTVQKLEEKEREIRELKQQLRELKGDGVLEGL